MAESGEFIAQCFNSTIGKSATQADEARAIVLGSSLASSISLALPAAQASTERFGPHGFLWRAEGSAKLLTTGYVAMEFQYTIVNFVPRWANPIWETFEVNASSEVGQILATTRKFSGSQECHLGIPTGHSWGYGRPTA